MIELKNINYQYQTYTRQSGFLGSLKDFGKRKSIRVTALENINISIAKGEIVGLLGPNGAGKTTLLKVMTGILEPSQGGILCNGKIPFEKNKEFLKKIGVVLGQKSQLIWDLPATETLRMLQVMYDIPKDVYDAKVRDMVQMLNVEGKLHTPVRKLSLGERIKFEIMCALIHEPEVLFLDEPTIGLDITSQYHIHAFLRHINQTSQTTIIITSHYMKDIEVLTNRVLLVMKGKLVEDVHISELKRRYTVDETFVIKFNTDIPEVFESYRSTENSIVVPVALMVEVVSRIADYSIVESIKNNTPSFEDIIFDIFSGKRCIDA